MELASKYNPSEVESKWYQYWMENGFFKSQPDEREPYTIVIPPPNVTGVLHMGHMLNNTIQDILIRRARMLGKNACWVPGTDHASIATEAKVVGKLAAEGIRKTDLTREAFLDHAWEWTHKHGGIILEQLKKLGASCDWDRTCFTMDKARSESVLKVFVDLYNKGLIYRGVRMVNWDPAALTALSDEEVIHKEQQGKLYYLRYKIEGESGWAVVATTRPETIMGDTAMCINPNDPKNAHLKGKKVIVPLINRVIPVIEDEYVDIEFGTGCLKVTPAHDVNDYMLGEKYNLPSIDIFNDNGTLNENGAQYAGKDRFEVRKQIEKDLADAGLLEKLEDYTNKVGFSERTNVPIEPKLSMQWFLKMEELAKPALDAVMSDEIQLVPPKFKNTYRHWMENVKDWCISRQLWWGHRIPAYFLPKGGVVVAESKEEAYQKALSIVNYPLSIDDLRQDEDVLDTWFSSWLWPISVFDGINYPDNKDISYYYPTSDLVTGPDILFFWVARMIISGYEYRQKPCFKNVYLTGIVRDKQGRKMSKSLGNSPEPLQLIEQFGADGVRMGMMLAAPAGNDILFDEALCEQGRNFNNKIWNALRLLKGWESADIAQPGSSKIAIRWFDAKLSQTIEEIDDLFGKYRISEALMAVYKLFWDDFSASYLELIKPAYQQPIDKATLNTTVGFFEKLLKLLHPFMPFITEELYHALNERGEKDSIMVSLMPVAGVVDNDLLAEFDKAKEIIAAVRTIRLEKNIPNKEVLQQLEFIGNHNSNLDAIIKKAANLNEIVESGRKLQNQFAGVMELTNKIKEITAPFNDIIELNKNIKAIIEPHEPLRDMASGVNEIIKSIGAASFMVGTTEYAVPLGNLIDVEVELKKLKEELEYQEGFLISVNKKLGNERFVANAKPEIVENERKKLADAESKIASLKESLEALSK